MGTRKGSPPFLWLPCLGLLLGSSCRGGENGGDPAGTAEGPQGGTWDVLVLNIAWPGEAAYSREDLAKEMEALASFIGANSSGRVSIAYDVTSPLTLPNPRSYYEAEKSDKNAPSTLMLDAMEAAAAAGFDYTKYGSHILIPSLGPGNNGAHGGKVWLSGLGGISLWSHEFGHSLGSSHSNGLAPDGAVVEYGNPFDNLGKGPGSTGHFNVRLKERFGWLSDSELTTVASSGTYRIQAHDLPIAGYPAGLKIRRDDASNYYVEFRQTTFSADDPGNPFVLDGALLLRGFNDWQYLNPTFSPQQSLLLDMTPETPLNWRDAALGIGRTYEDGAGGIQIRVVGKGGTVPETLDVEVVLSSTPAAIDRPAVVRFLVPQATTDSFSGSATFVVEAHDPDLGMADGSGIATVVLEIYNVKKEVPVRTSPPLAAPPYSWTVNPPLGRGGYVVLARATSAPEAGGQFNSLGTFFLVPGP